MKIGELKDGDKKVNVEGVSPALRYYRKHKDEPEYRIKWRASNKAWRARNPERVALLQKQQRLRIKMAVIEAYSQGTWACVGWNQKGCPFNCSDMRALTIDHIAGGGERHRRQIGEGGTFYAWLVANNFPPGFQVLCANCQQIKAIENHERRGNKQMVEISV